MKIKSKKFRPYALRLTPLARSGFTLIEVVIVIALVSLIIFSISSFSTNVSTLNNYSNQKLVSRQDVEQTLQMMVTDIRSASPSSIGSYPIESAASSSLVFYTDTNNDGIFERVRYFVSTSSAMIMRGITAPAGSPLTYNTSTEIVTPAVNYYIASSTPLFQYYDSSFTMAATSSLPSPVNIPAIRVVKVTFYADINPGAAPQPEYFSQTISMRNLKSN